MKTKLFSLIVILTSTLVLLSGCRKDTNSGGSNPLKFTDLKVDPSFTFDNFVTLSLNVSVNKSPSSNMNII